METLFGAIVAFCILFVLFYAVVQIVNYHKMQKYREKQRVARSRAETDKMVAEIRKHRENLDRLRRENPEEYQRIKKARMTQKARRSSRSRSGSRSRGSSTDNSTALMNAAIYSSTSSTWM